jgi:hypothetical protein
MNKQESIQRRQLVVDPKFQYGLIIKFVFIVTIVLVTSLGLLAFLYSRFASVSLPVSAETGGVVSFGATQYVPVPGLIWPVMFLARSDARNTVAQATSSGVCSRPSGQLAAR